MPIALRPSTTCCRDTPSPHDKHLLSVLLDADALSAAPRRVLSARERQWLTDLGCFRDGHRQIALRDRDRRHPHVAAYYDHARPFVDNNTSAGRSGSTCSCSISVRKLTILAVDFGGHRDNYGRLIDRFRTWGSDIVVDKGGDALGGREVGVAQRHAQLTQPIEREIDLTLDQWLRWRCGRRSARRG